MWGRKRQELLARLQGLIGKQIYRSTCNMPDGLSEEAAKGWLRLNLQFFPVTLMAVDNDRLFIRVDQVTNNAGVESLLGQIIPLPECFTDDAWAEWPVKTEREG